MNICVMRKKYLEELLHDASAHGYSNFYRDIIAKNMIKDDYRIYSFDGYYLTIDSISAYFLGNMVKAHP